MVMELVSRLSLASHSDSDVHALFSHDGCQREGFWEVEQCQLRENDYLITRWLTNINIRKSEMMSIYLQADAGKDYKPPLYT